MNATPEHFNEKSRKDLTGEDIRFTTKSGALYALVMGHNPRETRIPSLSPSRGLVPGKISRVALLGTAEPVQWKVSEDGLVIASPERWPSEHAVTFKVEFES